MRARQHYKLVTKTERLGDHYTEWDAEVTRKVKCSFSDPDALLVSSEADGEGQIDWHYPTLDIDFHAELIPSSTPDHFHLYLDKGMSWRTYKRLLKELARAGIIEEGYYGASVARKSTQVRLPHVKKGETPLPKDYAVQPGGVK